MMTLLRLAAEFFKTGLFAVGGGLATLPFLYEMGEKTGWFNAQDVLNLLAVSESTPGPIGINMSTYVGFITAGVPGAIAASLGFISPSVLIITLIAAFLESFASNVYVAHALAGIRVCVCVLILNSVLALGKKAIKNPLSWVVFLVSAFLAAFTEVPTVAIILGAGIVGYGLYLKGALKK